jgi:hypothetical protein
MMICLLLAPSLATKPAAPTLSELLRRVPLARRSSKYYSDFLKTGEFGYGPPTTSALPGLHILELSAGRRAAWSTAVATANPTSAVLATDVVAPSEVAPASTASGAPDNLARACCDNLELEQLRQTEPPFDVIFGGHVLCTCEWPVRLPAFARAASGVWRANATTEDAAAACTCGGVPLTRRGVETFVIGVGALLRPGSGVAVFDQEGGWPWGLESLLRDAAAAHSLHLYTRRAPLFSNVDYVLSTVATCTASTARSCRPARARCTSQPADVCATRGYASRGIGTRACMTAQVRDSTCAQVPLVDDVSTDPVQRASRVLDVALLLFPAVVLACIAAFRSGDLPREAIPAFEASKRAVAFGLMLRLVLPYAADVHTTSDLLRRWRSDND